MAMPRMPAVHMPAPVMPAVRRPQHVAVPNPQRTSHGENPNSSTGQAAGTQAVVNQAVPFLVTHRGFVNHYHNSYRSRLYPHQRTGAQLQGQLKNLINLKADLDALAQTAQAPTQKQKDLLHHDLMAVVERGVTAPEPEPARSLSGSLADLVAQKKRFPVDTERLVYDLDVVMNSPLATASEVGFAISNSQSLLRSAGLGRGDVEALAGHMKTVALR
jgi:hypothetical protein